MSCYLTAYVGSMILEFEDDVNEAFWRWCSWHGLIMIFSFFVIIFGCFSIMGLLHCCHYYCLFFMIYYLTVFWWIGWFGEDEAVYNLWFSINVLIWWTGLCFLFVVLMNGILSWCLYCLRWLEEKQFGTHGPCTWFPHSAWPLQVYTFGHKYTLIIGVPCKWIYEEVSLGQMPETACVYVLTSFRKQIQKGHVHDAYDVIFTFVVINLACLRLPSAFHMGIV